MQPKKEITNILRMKLNEFLRRASKRERAELAVVCNDSVAYLYQLAGQHRYASAKLATQLETQTAKVAARSGGRLGIVPRSTLVRHPEIFEWSVPLPDVGASP